MPLGLRRGLASCGLGLVLLTASAAGQRAAPSHYPDRTSPLLAQMSAVERSHSRLFSRFKGPRRLLDEQMSVFGLPREDAPQPPDVQHSTSNMLADLTCASGAVVEGTVLGGRSHPIDDGTFLFTDYDVRLARVFRRPLRSVFQPGQDVVITRPGGEVVVEGVTVHASSKLFPLLETGQSYLFFLKYLSATRDFQTTSDRGTFQIAGPRVRQFGIAPMGVFDADFADAGVGADSLRAMITSLALACRW